MRYARGDGYDLLLFDELWPKDLYVGPGLVIRLSGFVVVNDETLLGGQCAELFGRVRVYGDGRFAVAVDTREPLGNESGNAEVHDWVRHEKPWGYELEVPTARKTIQLKYIRVEDGHQTSLQYHVHKDECVLYMDEPALLSPKHVAPGTYHRESGPRSYVEASTYYPNDVIRIEDDYGRSTNVEEVK